MLREVSSSIPISSWSGLRAHRVSVSFFLQYLLGFASAAGILGLWHDKAVRDSVLKPKVPGSSPGAGVRAGGGGGDATAAYRPSRAEHAAPAVSWTWSCVFYCALRRLLRCRRTQEDCGMWALFTRHRGRLTDTLVPYRL